MLVEINSRWTKSFSQNYVLVAAQLELSDNFSLSDRWDRLDISTSLLDYLLLSDILEVTFDSAIALTFAL